jgi:hypothetical protein
MNFAAGCHTGVDGGSLGGHALVGQAPGLVVIALFELPPAKEAEKRRARAEQEPEVIPIAASRAVIERKLIPGAEDVDDEDDPGREAIPQSPKKIEPPHDDPPLLADSAAPNGQGACAILPPCLGIVLFPASCPIYIARSA